MDAECGPARTFFNIAMNLGRARHAAVTNVLVTIIAELQVTGPVATWLVGSEDLF